MPTKAMIDEAAKLIHENTHKAQATHIAHIVTSFRGMKQALRDEVDPKELDQIAATLTAGLWASQD
jgi:hypothetical protein